MILENWKGWATPSLFHTRAGDGSPWLGMAEVSPRSPHDLRVLVLYCWVTNEHKLRGLKQHAFVMSQFSGGSEHSSAVLFAQGVTRCFLPGAQGPLSRPLAVGNAHFLTGVGTHSLAGCPPRPLPVLRGLNLSSLAPAQSVFLTSAGAPLGDNLPFGNSESAGWELHYRVIKSYRASSGRGGTWQVGDSLGACPNNIVTTTGRGRKDLRPVLWGGRSDRWWSLFPPGPSQDSP